MAEKRRYQRFMVEGIEGTLMFTTDIDILNISINGVAMRARRRLEIGREYTLKLEFHDKVATLNGVIVWSVLSELGKGAHEEKVPVYRAGMKFTNVISEKMAKLLDFIEENKLPPYERLTIRFDLGSADKASLSTPHNYKVTKVSESGMLVETSMPFEVEEQLPMEIYLYDERTIRVRGRVASCIEIADAVPKHYDIGIEFMEISKSDRIRFRDFIDSLRLTQS